MSCLLLHDWTYYPLNNKKIYLQGTNTPVRYRTCMDCFKKQFSIQNSLFEPSNKWTDIEKENDISLTRDLKLKELGI